jgi:hypothetical protein
MQAWLIFFVRVNFPKSFFAAQRFAEFNELRHPPARVIRSLLLFINVLRAQKVTSHVSEMQKNRRSSHETIFQPSLRHPKNVKEIKIFVKYEREFKWRDTTHIGEWRHSRVIFERLFYDLQRLHSRQRGASRCDWTFICHRSFDSKSI